MGGARTVLDQVRLTHCCQAVPMEDVVFLLEPKPTGGGASASLMVHIHVNFDGVLDSLPLGLPPPGWAFFLISAGPTVGS